MTYSPQFFADRAARADRDARMMVPDLSATLGRCPASVIDFGCGDGAMLRWWGQMGASSLIGIDQHGPDEWARAARGLHLRLDLTSPIALDRRADLVVCLEVAEHLPESAADTLVETLVRHGNRIVFSAAPPGQGGTDHVNEQPIEYWKEKFARHDYVLQDIIRHRLSPHVSPWYRANTYLVAKRGHEVVVPRAVVMMARYRDCFPDIQDAVADITKGPYLPHVYGVHPFELHELSYSATVDKTRSQLASEFIDLPRFAGTDYALWIDADTVFSPQQAVDLVMACHANRWQVCTGHYSTKQKRGRIIHKPFPGGRVQWGPYAQPHQVWGVGYGFVVTHRSAFEQMALDERAGVERCYFGDGSFGWDLFRPKLGEFSLDWVCPMTGRLARPYWSEDYSWSERAVACGIEQWVQPQVFPKHRGRFDFGPENVEAVEEVSA